MLPNKQTKDESTDSDENLQKRENKKSIVRRSQPKIAIVNAFRGIFFIF